MKAFLLLMLFVVGCATNQPTPTPVETTPVNQNAKVQFLDSLEFPQFAKEENWKNAVKRTVLAGQVTGFVVRGDLCSLPLDNSFGLQGIDVKYPSAIEYKTGTYYDIMVPMTKENCSTFKFGWIDVSESMEGITLVKKGTVTKVPTMPLTILIGPHGMNLGLNNQEYKNGDEKLSLQANKLMNQHRISVHEASILRYDHELDSLYPFKEYVLGSSLGVVNLPFANYSNDLLSKMDKEVEGYKWFYVVDEPNADQLKALPPTLAKLKTYAPNTKRLVTTFYKEGMDIDLYCPPFEHLDYFPREKYGKNFCVYGACMSNGCGENRAWTNGKFTHYDYHRSGSPDIVIDAPYENEFAWFMVGAKYKADFMLYYASIESWLLPKVGIDILKDQYNFGGNGDGTLLYPDYKNKVAIPSIRLKMLREASYLLDASVQFGKKDYLLDKVKSGTSWTFDYSDREKVFE